MVVLFQRRNLITDLPNGGRDLTIQQLVQRRLITSLFQPIVRLDNREVVGYEAFVRGPQGSAFERPGEMFGAAEAVGLTWELDLAASTSALSVAVQSDLPSSMSLFINVDPASFGKPVPADLAEVLAGARPRFQVFMEMSERSLSVNAGSTLASIEKGRATGWGVSLDNVGLSVESLALLPFARPDVVKIDVSLVHKETHPHAPRLVSAVTAHAERTKASIMAMGIETEGHLRTAQGLGATLGQGYLLGRPGDLPVAVKDVVQPIPLIRSLTPVKADDTPFKLATVDHPALPASKAMLEALAGNLEQRAIVDPDPPVVLACLPTNQLMSGTALTFLQFVSRAASFTAAVVRETPTHQIPDVRLSTMDRADPLNDEMSIILIGAHYSAMLTAKERTAGIPANGYTYRLLYDRNTVTRAAWILLRRFTGARG